MVKSPRYLFNQTTMNKKQMLLAAVLIWIVGTIFSWLTCGWLFNWIYTIEPIIWQPVEVIMSTGSFVGSSLLGLLTSILFVLVYAVFYKGIPGKGVKKGMAFGFFIWLVSGLSGMITMPFYMTIATTVVAYWIISALVMSLIKGAIVGAIYKK